MCHPVTPSRLLRCAGTPFSPPLCLFCLIPFKWFRKMLTYYIIFCVISHRNFLAVMNLTDLGVGLTVAGLPSRPPHVWPSLSSLPLLWGLNHHPSVVLAWPYFGHIASWLPPVRTLVLLAQPCLPACCHCVGAWTLSGDFWLAPWTTLPWTVTCSKHCRKLSPS